MTSGFDAFSLGLFTSLAPAGVVAFLALAIAGLSMKRVQSRRTTLALRATASLLALAAVFVTRIVFYHLHMTVGF